MLAAEVAEEDAVSDEFAGVNVVVYDQSFTWEDLAPDSDEHEGAEAASGDAATFIRRLLKRMGATISMTRVADTALAVGLRGHRVTAHQDFCNKGKADTDIVSPVYIQACARAGCRLDPLPHGDLVFAGAESTARLPTYSDSAGDHLTLPITVRGSATVAAIWLSCCSTAIAFCGCCATGFPQAARFAAIAAASSAGSSGATAPAAAAGADMSVAREIERLRVKLGGRGLPASDQDDDLEDEDPDQDEADGAATARAMIRCSQRLRPWLGHTVFLASTRSSSALKRLAASAAASMAGARVVEAPPASVSIVVDCDGERGRASRAAIKAVGGSSALIVHHSDVPGNK
jgi:hypothetical protein